MSSYQFPPPEQSGDPYGQPYPGPQQEQPYPGPDPYQQPYAQPHPDPYAQPYPGQYQQPQQYGQQYPGAYQPAGQPGPTAYPPPGPARPRRPDPYEELGSLGQEDDASSSFAPNPAPAPAAVPAGPPPAPRKRRRLVGCLGVVGLLVVGIGGVTGYRYLTAGQYRLVPPDSFQGLVPDPSNALAKALASSSGQISQAGATPVSAAYSSHVGDRVPQLVLIGGYGRLLAPETEVSTAWSELSGGGHPVTGKVDVPGGPLGGTVQCAVATAGPAQVPVCIWADSSSMAMVLFTGQMSRSAIHPDFTALGRRLLALRGLAEIKK